MAWRDVTCRFRTTIIQTAEKMPLEHKENDDAIFLDEYFCIGYGQQIVDSALDVLQLREAVSQIVSHNKPNNRGTACEFQHKAS